MKHCPRQQPETWDNTRDQRIHNNNSNMAHKEELQEKGHVKKVVYLDILRTNEYAKWKANPQLVGDAALRTRRNVCDPALDRNTAWIVPISTRIAGGVAGSSRYAPPSAVLLSGREPHDGGIAVERASFTIVRLG